MQKEVIRTSKAPKPVGPYSQAIAAGNFVFVSGQVGTNPGTGRVAKTTKEQTKQVLENLRSILEAAGSSLEMVLRVGVFLKDISDFAEMNKVYQKYFHRNQPARTTVQAALVGEYRVEIDALALRE